MSAKQICRNTRGSTFEGPICCFHHPTLRPQRSHWGQSGSAAPIKEQNWADYRARWRWWHQPPVVGRLSVVSQWTARTVTERAWKLTETLVAHEFWQEKMAKRTSEIICFTVPSCDALQGLTKVLPKPAGRVMKVRPKKIKWFHNNVTGKKRFSIGASLCNTEKTGNQSTSSQNGYTKMYENLGSRRYLRLRNELYYDVYDVTYSHRKGGYSFQCIVQLH